jgi:hypothetical protein
MWPHHPDDEPSPRFGGWADDFNTFEDACRFYGCDSPADLRREAEAEFEADCVVGQDEIEARGGPIFRVHAEEIPF